MNEEYIKKIKIDNMDKLADYRKNSMKNQFQKIYF